MTTEKHPINPSHVRGFYHKQVRQTANSFLSSGDRLQEETTDYIHALARKAAQAYPEGIDPAPIWTPVETSLVELSLLCPRSSSPVTSARYLLQFMQFGLVRGDRCQRPGGKNFTIEICTWLLVAQNVHKGWLYLQLPNWQNETFPQAWIDLITPTTQLTTAL